MIKPTEVEKLAHSSQGQNNHIGEENCQYDPGFSVARIPVRNILIHLYLQGKVSSTDTNRKP
jgi:hypothetical protein